MIARFPPLRSLLLSLVLLWPVAAAAEPVAPPDLIAPPKTLAFLGDSITHMGTFHQFLQLFLATRYPGADLWTVNAGWSGDNAGGGLKRWSWDLSDNPRPDVVFVHFGMNDVGRDSYVAKADPPSDESRQKTRDRYTGTMTELIKQLMGAGMRVVVLSPTIFDDTADRWDNRGERPHLDGELQRFGRMGQQIAEKAGARFIDLHAPLLEIIRREQAKDPTFSLEVDRVHPRNGGEEIMLATILEALGVSPYVYDVAIDAANGKSERQVNAEAGNIQVGEGIVAFDLTEHALPFPTPPKRRGFELSDFDARLNQQRLAVKNLPAGQYELRIDATALGEYSSKQLAEGIQLATNEKTPQHQAAAKLSDAVLGRKLELEQQVRAMAAILKEDWRTVDPAAAVVRIDAEIEARKARNAYRGWSGYILPAAKKAIVNREKILAGLAEVREQLRRSPATSVHRYELRPVAASK